MSDALSHRLARRLSGNVRGALWLLATAAAFSALNGLVKHLGDRIHPFEIAFFRSVFGLILLAPYMVRHNFAILSTRRVGLHIARVAFGVFTMLASFYAMTHMVLATAMAVFFANTLFVIPLAVFLLHERVPWPRWLATAIGFCGVLIVLRPGAGSLELAALAAVAAAATNAVVLVTVKMLADTERPVTVMLWFTVAAVPASLLPALPFWVTPDWTELTLLAATGVLGTAGQYWMIRAYRVGEATAVTPFVYFQLPFAAVIGFFGFGEVPDGWTFVGAAVIAATGLYLARSKPLAPAPLSRQ